ncbi:MAG: hypothetical protein JO020_33650 [Chloroflexi bacterium]|nr:hypothetical protein [Chloroflexota bacterium]MBV9899128.1 hypothetical protein [Chloroflexota bacterium]
MSESHRPTLLGHAGRRSGVVDAALKHDYSLLAGDLLVAPDVSMRCVLRSASAT